jgi:hypothetical protein
MKFFPLILIAMMLSACGEFGDTTKNVTYLVFLQNEGTTPITMSIASGGDSVGNSSDSLTVPPGAGQWIKHKHSCDTYGGIDNYWHTSVTIVDAAGTTIGNFGASGVSGDGCDNDTASIYCNDTSCASMGPLK